MVPQPRSGSGGTTFGVRQLALEAPPDSAAEDGMENDRQQQSCDQLRHCTTRSLRVEDDDGHAAHPVDPVVVEDATGDVGDADGQRRSDDIAHHVGEGFVIYEGQSTRIVRYRAERYNDIEGASSSAGTETRTRPHEVVIKSIIDPSPLPEDVSSLQNEYSILSGEQGVRMVQSGATRGVIPRGKGQDGEAQNCNEIYLEWVEGVTLKEWQSRRQRQQREGPGGVSDVASPSELKGDLLDLTKMMLGVATSLAKVHEAGISHNDVAADNIIVVHSEKDVGRGRNRPRSLNTDCYWTKMIDFGYASQLSSLETDDVGETINDDLYGLGVVFAELLTDAHDGGYKEQFSDSLLFGSTPTYDLSTHTPLSLIRLLVNLAVNVSTQALDSEVLQDDHERYRSVVEVRDDLRQMVTDPTRFLFDLDADGDDHPPGRLIFAERQDGGLYGRFREEAALRKACFQDRLLRGRRGDENDKDKCLSSEGGHTNGNGVDDGGSCGNGHLSRDGSGLLRPPPPPAGLVLVAGPPGSGKMTLVDHVFRRKCKVDADGGCMVGPGLKCEDYYLAFGKFDALNGGYGAPYSALVAAYTELCDLILPPKFTDETTTGEPCYNFLGQSAEEAAALDEVAFRIREALGDEGKVLTDVIPNLDMILEEPTGPTSRSTSTATKTTSVGGVEARNRFNFLLRSFARAVAQPEKPVILLLDDLQWADQASLEMIKTLVTDTDNPHLLVVGCYRDDEVSDNDPLASICRDVERGGSSIGKVRVENLGKEALNEFVSDSLRLLKRQTSSLTNLVYRKTHGNMYYVKEFLGTLHKEGLLRYDAKSRRWVWDDAEIRAMNVVGSVVGLMSDKILALPPEIQDVLKTAACFGSQFDIETLTLVMDNRSDVEDNLDIALIEGLVDHLGKTSKYKFAHNRIKQAAYSLIPVQQRAELHFKIGSVMQHNAEAHVLERDLFLIVDQLNMGASCVTEPKKVGLAALNLRAGEKAMSSAAYTPAESYLKAGIGLLPNDYWQDNYDLSLSLFSSLAESKYCAGNVEDIEHIIQEVVLNALSFMDIFRVYLIQIKSLGAQGKLQEALDAAMYVMDMLGEPFPRSTKASAIMVELVKTKLALRGKSVDELVQLPIMDDETKLAAMQVLNSMMFCAMLGKMEYVPFIVFRMVRISLRSGVCGVSAYGFAMYGMMLCGHMGDLKGGHHFGQVALLLVEKLKANEWYARVSAFVYIFIHHWFKPLENSLQPLLYAHRVGMETGDVEYAMMSAQTYCNYSFHCGRPLAALEGQMRVYCLKMVEHKQEMTLMAGLPLWQTLLNLLGRSRDPLQLTGEAMDQELMLKKATIEGNANQECTIYISVMKLAYIFGDFEFAGRMAEKSRKILKLKFTFELCSYSFFAGLVSVSMARETKEKKWRARAKKSLTTVKKWAKTAPNNCLQKVFLLKAEIYALRGKVEKAQRYYEAAIAFAREHKYVQDEALAYERAGAFFLEANDKVRASHYYARAYQSYTVWGAQAKADLLLSQASSLVTEGMRENSFQVFLKGQTAMHVHD